MIKAFQEIKYTELSAGLILRSLEYKIIEVRDIGFHCGRLITVYTYWE